MAAPNEGFMFNRAWTRYFNNGGVPHVPLDPYHIILNFTVDTLNIIETAKKELLKEELNRLHKPGSISVVITHISLAEKYNNTWRATHNNRLKIIKKAIHRMKYVNGSISAVPKGS